MKNVVIFVIGLIILSGDIVYFWNRIIGNFSQMPLEFLFIALFSGILMFAGAMSKS